MVTKDRIPIFLKRKFGPKRTATKISAINSELVKPNEPDGKDNKRVWRRTDRKTEIETKQTTDRKPQSTNCCRNIYFDRRCAEKKTTRKRQHARYKGSLSNSAKNY